MLSSYARLDPELAAWIEAEVAFPNGMVDRITPVTTAEDVAQISERFGVADAWPVVAEPFFQWVLEDHFVAGRPAWQDAGVQLVPEVEPYELMKLRLLNAGHQAVAYLGHLMGYRYVHEAARTRSSPATCCATCVGRASPRSGGARHRSTAYRDTLIERFGNAEVRDTVARLAGESSDRIPKWLVPVIDANLARAARSRCQRRSWRAGPGTPRASTSTVNRSRWWTGSPRSGWPRPRQPGGSAGLRPQTSLFGDLADQQRFTEAYLEALRMLHEKGARATVEAWV